jgi:phosphatidylglycerophosphate synthase
MIDNGNRRPIKTRASAWAHSFAAELARDRVSPDLISGIGLACAVVGFGALALSGLSEGAARVVWLGLAFITIQLRLLANMLDGMVGVEHGKASPVSPIWNALPDPITDGLFFVGAGYGAILAEPNLGPAFGWLCALLAAVTAYVRLLRTSLGFAPD